MNIYEEAFNDLLKYFHENKPLENIDDTLVKIEHGLERAKKVEELLEYQNHYVNSIVVELDRITNKAKASQIEIIKKELEEMK